MEYGGYDLNVLYRRSGTITQETMRFSHTPRVGEILFFGKDEERVEVTEVRYDWFAVRRRYEPVVVVEKVAVRDLKLYRLVTRGNKDFPGDPLVQAYVWATDERHAREMAESDESNSMFVDESRATCRLVVPQEGALHVTVVAK